MAGAFDRGFDIGFDIGGDVTYNHNTEGVFVEINDRPTHVENIRISNVLTSEPDSATFSIKNPRVEPIPGYTVLIYRESTSNKLFGGLIVDVTKENIAHGGIQNYNIVCSDYQRLLDRYLVAKSYSSSDCHAIISDFVDTYTDSSIGFTCTNVQTGPSLTKATFNYFPVSQCIKELAEMVGYDWYVDYDKDIHFFEEETTTAPWNVTDDTLEDYVKGLVIKPDYSQIRNRVYVRGGYTLSSAISDIQDADTNQTHFNLGYKPHNLTMKVDGVAKTIGIENIDDEASYDYMMNYNEALVRCSSGTGAPGDGAVMTFMYKYEHPVIARKDDDASQAVISDLEGGDGIYEHMVVDTNISTKAEAYNRAEAELEQFSNPWITGTFTTFEHGFQAGQTIEVDITGETYNGSYQVRRVDIACLKNHVLQYTVTFATTLYDLVEFLSGMYRDSRKRIYLRDDELVDLLEYANDTVTLSEAHTPQLWGHPSKWGERTWGLFTWA